MIIDLKYDFLLYKKMFIHLLSGKKGQYVWTDCVDEEALSKGVYNTYTSKNLRYSQVGQSNPTHMHKYQII